MTHRYTRVVRIGAFALMIALIGGMFGTAPTQAGSVTQLSISANPDVSMLGIPVSITLSDRWLLNEGKPPILTANVNFGDGSMQMITLLGTVTSTYTGSTVHAYMHSGTYTIQATDQRGAISQTTVTITAPTGPAPMPSATPQPTASPTPQPARTPQPTSPPTPIPTQTPNATPPASTGQITNLTLAWPNGTAQLSVASGQSVPAPNAGVALSIVGPVTLQWSIDGSPANVSNITESSANATQQVSYPGSLPSSVGQHTVSVRILSPSNATQVASVKYVIAGSTPSTSPAATPQVLHFDGFHLYIKTITQQGSTYSGTGTVTLADSAPITMAFTNVTFNAPTQQSINGAMYSVADVTAGTADPQGVRNSTICPASAPSSIHIGPNAPGPGGFAILRGALGNFSDQGYHFALQTLHLVAIGAAHSNATMCYPTTFPDGSSSKTNVACANNVQNQFHHATIPTIAEMLAMSNCITSIQSARVIAVPTTNIDEVGHFDDDVAGNTVGQLCIGVNGCPATSAFYDEPSATDALEFRFGPSDASPNIHFPGVAVNYDPFVSAISGYTGPWSNAAAKTPMQDWLPDGKVNATIAFADGAQLLTPTNGLILTCHGCTSTIANGALTGGKYAGQFATGAKLPTLTYVGGPFHGGVFAFDARQVAMNQGHFGNGRSVSTNLGGSFSGTQNADGSMFAPISGMAATMIAGAAITPSGGLLALNGQVSGMSSGIEYLTARLRQTDPFWNSPTSNAQGPRLPFDIDIEENGGGQYGTGEPIYILDSGVYLTAGTFPDGESFGAKQRFARIIGGQPSAYGFLFYGNDGYFGQIGLNGSPSGQ
ncbi:MAG: PKD domain-containing protein, partial [Vulcanimicrobiaceae bacterium]